LFGPKGDFMKVRAAALLSAPGKYETIDVELDGPRQNEVLVRVVAAGLCHSDDHIATGDLPVGKYHGRIHVPVARHHLVHDEMGPIAA
jgi:D-arabinose 1-dehydrogenase-like Zn-dependent alcohol dehydrogenase